MPDSEVRPDGSTVITDAMVERAAFAVERDRRPGWTDAQFDIWWNRDPWFVSQTKNWGWFTGTEKEKVLHEARLGLEAAFEQES